MAEDNDINALFVERHLSRLGAQVVRAQDGSEAVALVSSGGEKFDAALMDVRMPGLDEFQPRARFARPSKGPGPIGCEWSP